MNFDFSEEQKELRDHARRFLKDQCTWPVVRGVLEGAAPSSRSSRACGTVPRPRRAA